MLEKQSSPRVPPVVTVIGSDFSLDETDTSVFGVQNQVFAVFDSASISGGLEGLWLRSGPEVSKQNADFGAPSLVSAVKNLIDVVGKSKTSVLSSLTESDYQEFVTILDDLIDVVGENESHILAPVMDFIGILIESYEDEYVPELTIA